MNEETGQMIEELVSEGCYSLLVDMEYIRPGDRTMQFSVMIRNENGDIVAKKCDPDLAKIVTQLYTEFIGDPIDEEENDYDYPEADDYTPGGEDDTNV
jgi:hypothetical protein